MAEQRPQSQPQVQGQEPVIMGAWTLTGSARFEKQYHDWARYLAFAGHPCFTLACFPSQMGSKDWAAPGQKAMLDHIHTRMIDMSQAVLILNVGGYIGESTIRAAFYALNRGKAVFSIEPFKNKAVKLSDRAREFKCFDPDAPGEIYAVVGSDLERYVMSPQATTSDNTRPKEPEPASAGGADERSSDATPTLKEVKH